MKTKLEMAHDYAMQHLKNSDGKITMHNLCLFAWQYADAMQAEADKRNKEEAEQKRKSVREMLNAANTFLEKEGQHFDDVEEWQPDKRNNPQPVITEQDKKRAEQAYANIVKPPIKEWQPDWSQAPSWANWWAMDEDKKTRWIYSELEQPYISDMFLRWCAVGRFNSENAPSFDYTGCWRDSLRERPQ